MIEKKIERTVLKRIEKMSRKEAESCKVGPVPPWPDCPFILHQPKRPKNS